MDEFELTFLPKKLPEGIFTSPSKEMLAIYIPAASEHPTLRIRRSGTKHEMTKKEPVSAGDSSHQRETTVPLTVEEFSDLTVVPGKRVSKIRYFYLENGVDYEVDVFQGELEGLVLIDVEFKSTGDKAKFKAPEWILIEVTQEKFIAGGMLCGKKYSDIEDRLKLFGYKKL